MLFEILKFILCDYLFNLVLEGNSCINRNNENNIFNILYWTILLRMKGYLFFVFCYLVNLYFIIWGYCRY